MDVLDYLTPAQLEEQKNQVVGGLQRYWQEHGSSASLTGSVWGNIVCYLLRVIGCLRTIRRKMMKSTSCVPVSAENVPEDFTCAICLDGLDTRRVIRTQCQQSHYYHRQCMKGWVEKGHQTCPTCRGGIMKVQFPENPLEIHADLDVKRMISNMSRDLYGETCN